MPPLLAVPGVATSAVVVVAFGTVVVVPSHLALLSFLFPVVFFVGLALSVCPLFLPTALPTALAVVAVVVVVVFLVVALPTALVVVAVVVVVVAVVVVAVVVAVAVIAFPLFGHKKRSNFHQNLLKNGPTLRNMSIYIDLCGFMLIVC